MNTQNNWYTLDMLLKTIKRLVKPFTGIPAPKVLKDDPWFGPAHLSEKQEEYIAMRAQCEAEQLLIPQAEDMPRKEVDNIHEVMYNIATKHGKTTTQLDPMPQLGGGSEGYQSGPGGWHSGTGYAQFRHE